MDSCQDLEEIPKPKRPRLEEEEREKEDTSTKPSATESDKFAINFRAFLSEKNVVVKDFEKLLHHVVNVLGAENMADLKELQPDDLSEDKTGIETCISVRYLTIVHILEGEYGGKATQSRFTHYCHPPACYFENPFIIHYLSLSCKTVQNVSI